MGVSEFLFGKPKPKKGEPASVPGSVPEAAAPTTPPVQLGAETESSRREDRRPPVKRPPDPKPDNRPATKEDFKQLVAALAELKSAINEGKEVYVKFNDNYCIGYQNLVNLLNQMIYPEKEVNLEEITANIPVTIDPRLAAAIAGPNGEKPARPASAPAANMPPSRNPVGRPLTQEMKDKMAEGRRRKAAERKQAQRAGSPPDPGETDQIFGEPDGDLPPKQQVSTES